MRLRFVRNSSPFFRYIYLFLKIGCDRTFTTAALSPVTKLSTIITALKSIHVNWTILLSMHYFDFFLRVGC